MLAAEKFVEDWPRIDALEGWLSRDSAALMDFLLAGQEQIKVPGLGIVEIGVWKGRSAALMARHLRTGEDLLLVDPWLKQNEVTASLQAVLGERLREHPVSLFPGTAREAALAIAPARRYRFIHIDGEHTAAGLRGDLQLALRLMEPAGMVVLDDVMNDMYPQLTRAMFEFLDNEGRDLACVVLGFNKACLCRTRLMDAYGDLVFTRLNAEMAARETAVTLCRTTDRVEWPGYSVVRDIGVPKRGPDNNSEYLRP